MFFFFNGSKMQPLNIADCCSWMWAQSNTAWEEKHPLRNHCENWYHRRAAQTSNRGPGPAVVDTHQIACSRRTEPPPRLQSRLDGNKNIMEIKLVQATHCVIGYKRVTREQQHSHWQITVAIECEHQERKLASQLFATSAHFLARIRC